MKPVEIEILMKDGMTPGLKNAGRIIRQFSDDSKAELKEVSESLKLQRQYVSQLEKNLRELEKAFKTAAPGAEWGAAKTRIEEVKKELEEEKAGLAELIDKENQLKAASEGADVSLRQQLRNLTQEIATLMVAYAQLSDEERATAAGKALQHHIEELTEQAGILRDAMGDTTAAINNAASDTRGFDQMAGALQLAIDGFGLATAGAEMFGVSQEDLVEAQTKLQAALVASNALSSIQNNLQKQSALMQGVNIIQTKAAATAETIKTAVQGRGVIVTKAATVAQAAFNAVAKANPYVLLAMACVTVVGALYAFAKGSKAAKEAEEERQKQMERTREINEGIASSIGQTAGAQIAAYTKLQRAWNALGEDLKKRKKFVDDNKKAFQELGLSVNSVKDAEEVLVNNTSNVVQSFILRAKAAALDKAVTDAYSTMLERQDLARRNAKYKVQSAGDEVSYADAKARGMAGVRAVPHEHYRANGGGATSSSWTTYTYEVTDAKAYNAASNRLALAARDKEIAAAQREADRRVNELQREIGATEAAYNALKIPQMIGGVSSTPELTTLQPTTVKPTEDERVEQERRVAEELRKLRWKNQQEEIDQLEDGAEKRRRQIALDYEKQLAEIQELEDKWRELQNGNLTPEQDKALTEARTLANNGMKDAIRQVEKDEVAKNREKLNELLEQYKDYDQRRRDIESSYKADMETLNAELARLQSEGLDTTEVKSAISAREQAYKASISALEGEILQASDFYDKLFGTVSDRGYKVLKDFYSQTKETLENAKVDGDGVEISIPVKDADGKFVKKAVKITVDEYRRMLKQVQEIKKQLEKDNPFAAFRTSWSALNKAIKENGDVSGALKELNAKGKEVTGTIRGWGESLGEVFGDNFKNSMNEILTFCDGAMDMGTGIAQIWSGDIVGGITNALSGLASIFSMFSSWKEKMEEMKREWYIAEIETNRALRERSAEYAANRSQISDIIKDVELLNWLIEKGYAKPSSVSVWEAQSSALSEYTNNLRKETAVYDELWEKIQGSEGHYEWGNSLNGGSATWSLRGYNADMIELWYNQGKLSDEAKAYYEAWVESGKTVEELIDKINECKESMREMVMGVSFDSFLSNAADALKKMRGDVSELGKFTEDTLAEAILNGFMYRDLAKVLEPLYNELSDAFIDGTADEAYLEEWRRRFEEVMSAAGDRLDAVADAAGVDLDGSSGTSQSGKASSFTAMSQDQGTKLEGLFVSVQMHTASIDEKMEDVTDKMTQASETLRKIEENTGRTADKLEEVAEDVKKIIRDGIKTR